MNTQEFAHLSTLLERQEGPCLSLYQATHRSHPDNAQDPIRFKNLVKNLEESLASTYKKNEYEPLLQRFHELADDFDFWQHTLDGLAIFANKDDFRFMLLQRPTPDFAVVSDSYHVKPLLRQTQTLDRFQVLCLTRAAAQLFEGNRDALDHVVTEEGFPDTLDDTSISEHQPSTLNLSSYRLGAASRGGVAMFHGHGGRSDAIETQTLSYFREVDKAVIEQVSRPSGLPLVLVTLAENQGEFRKLSNNNQLVEQGISIDPTALKIEDLHKRCWEIIQPIANERAAGAISAFKQKFGTGLASDNPQEVLGAILDGRVETILVSAEKRIAGRIQREERSIELLDGFNLPDAEDVLDDLGEMTLRRGGSLWVLPDELMPSDTGIAATYRF